MSDPSRREQIEANFAAAETAPSVSESPAPDLAVSTTPTSPPADGSVDTAPPGDAGDTGPSETPAAKAERARDRATGKFTKSSESAGAPPKQGSVTSTKAAASAVAPSSTAGVPPPVGGDSLKELKAPQAWKAAAREAFNNLPPELKAHPGVMAIVEDAVRREKEHQAALEHQKPLREAQVQVQQFQQALAPVQQLMQLRGVSPAQAMASYAQYDLMLSNPATAARAAAQLIQNYGIDIGQLDAALSGTVAPQAGQQSQSNFDPVAFEQQMFQKWEQRNEAARQQMAFRQAQQEMTKLSEGLEFYEDVRQDMADMLTSYAQRGLKLTPQEAYDKCIWANPELRAIIQQREQAKAAATAQAATQRAQAAASSIKNQPASPVGHERNGSRRADIEAAIARLNGGR